MLFLMTDSDSAIVLSDSDLDLVEELRSIRETVKNLKAREEEIRTVLLQELKDSEYGLTASGDLLIEVERQQRSRLDSKKLQALYEDVWNDCQIKTTVEVLRLPETNTV
jgi:predicted phage-related endonuclease